MNINKRYGIFFVLLLAFFSQIPARILILDVNDTLYRINQKALFNNYSFAKRLRGYFSALTYMVRGGKSYLKTCYFQELSQAACSSTVDYQIFSDDGVTPLPPLLTESLLGNLTYEQVKNLWYAKDHADIFNKIFEFTFDPTRYVASLEPMPTVDIIQRYAQEKDEHGNPKNYFILLSNFAPEMIAPFKEKFKSTIMAWVGCDDNCIFSGEYHCCKPGPKIYAICYERILQIYALHPEQKDQHVFFFDDQSVNCNALAKYLNEYFAPGQLICAHPDHMENTLANNNALPVAGA